MPDNPLQNVVKEMEGQLRTRPLDINGLSRRQDQLNGEPMESATPEPGQPDSPMSEV